MVISEYTRTNIRDLRGNRTNSLSVQTIKTYASDSVDNGTGRLKKLLTTKKLDEYDTIGANVVMKLSKITEHQRIYAVLFRMVVI
jgi:hypothetical protein